MCTTIALGNWLPGMIVVQFVFPVLEAELFASCNIAVFHWTPVSSYQRNQEDKIYDKIT